MWLYYPRKLPTPELFWNGIISSLLAWKMSQEWEVLTRVTFLNISLLHCACVISVSETVYLGLCCCSGSSLVAVPGLLIAVASLAAEHEL